MSHHNHSHCNFIGVCSIIDLFEVVSELEPVAYRWKHIGRALRLDQGQLKKIEKENKDDIDDCLSEALTLWLNKNYDTEKFGEPSWELLAEAVGHPAGGNNSALAEGIRQRHSKHTLLAYYTLFTTSLFANHCSSNRLTS